MGHYACKGSPFLKCVVLVWALPIRGGGVKACQDSLGHFFPRLPRGVRTCHDGLVLFFFTFARLTDKGGRGEGGSKAIWAMPI